MSMGWETTEDDVMTVLSAHNIKVTKDRLKEIYEGLDLDAIEAGVYYYTSIDAQTDSMLCDIEDQLMEQFVIVGKEKQYDEADEDDDELDEDWDDEEDA
jgi:hypothetical protein